VCQCADHGLQYFLRTADDDVARYLKLFTFLPLDHIETVMAHHAQNESKRVPQHLLAKEVVSLAHGAAHASKAEAAHKEAFSYGTNMFHIGALRRVLEKNSPNEGKVEKNRKINEDLKQFLRYKREVAAASTKQPNAAAATAEVDASNVVTLPLTLLTDGAFPAVLLAAGLANSKSEARRMIQNNGVYVVLPNSGSAEEPHGLKWAPIPHGEGEVPNPRHYLLDFEALVLRSGKSKIQICRIITEEQFRAESLTFPGWNALAQSAEPTRKE
jgi:tyrosyl-tRNA synthetase